MGSQAITPELRAWIIGQAQSGKSVKTVLKSLTDAGWQESVAIEAMEGTLHVHLKEQAVKMGLPPASPVPVPALDDSPLYLDAGDRRVAVLSHMVFPPITVFGDFLSPEECDALIEAARPQLKRSLTIDTKTGGEELNAARTSSGMFFRRGETELLTRIETRIAALLRWPIENGEGMQVLHYHPGAEYRPHYDYFDPAEPGTPTILKRGGQRVGTFLMYLNEPAKGGGTTFPDVRFEVAPKRGNAVFFSYERPHASTQSLHGGAPVIEGEKWIATKWLRERRFD